MAFVVVSFWAVPTRIAAQACAPANDTTASMLAELKVFVASTKPFDIASRQTFSIPAVDSATVTHVTQNNVCQKALAAFNTTIAGYTPLPTRVYLAKLGNVYVAMNPLTPDHVRPFATLDSKYRVLKKFLM